MSNEHTLPKGAPYVLSGGIRVMLFLWVALGIAGIMPLLLLLRLVAKSAAFEAHLLIVSLILSTNLYSACCKSYC